MNKLHDQLGARWTEVNGVRVVAKGLMPASYLELAIQLELNKAAGK